MSNSWEEQQIQRHLETLKIFLRCAKFVEILDKYKLVSKENMEAIEYILSKTPKQVFDEIKNNDYNAMLKMMKLDLKHLLSSAKNSTKTPIIPIPMNTISALVCIEDLIILLMLIEHFFQDFSYKLVKIKLSKSEQKRIADFKKQFKKDSESLFQEKVNNTDPLFNGVLEKFSDNFGLDFEDTKTPDCSVDLIPCFQFSKYGFNISIFKLEGFAEQEILIMTNYGFAFVNNFYGLLEYDIIMQKIM